MTYPNDAENDRTVDVGYTDVIEQELQYAVLHD